MIKVADFCEMWDFYLFFEMTNGKTDNIQKMKNNHHFKGNQGDDGANSLTPLLWRVIYIQFIDPLLNILRLFPLENFVASLPINNIELLTQNKSQRPTVGMAKKIKNAYCILSGQETVT